MKCIILTLSTLDRKNLLYLSETVTTLEIIEMLHENLKVNL